MRIAVIGAGIGGLATAVGLQGTGAAVIVFERAPGPAAEGSGLSIFGNGWAALDAIGASAPLRTIAGGPMSGLTAGQRRPDGRWLVRTPPEAIADVRVVHRAELQQVLLGVLAPGTVRFGHAVTDPAGFDVVVAADGIRSPTRATWEGDPGVAYAGYAAWRAVTDRPVDLCGAAGETWGRGLRFGYGPLRDGRVYWYGVVSLPQDAIGEMTVAGLRERFASWHDPIPALLDATHPAAVYGLPIEYLAGRLPSFVRHRTVLLGDAAHAMTPDLGQGGNQALEDAAVLTARLAAAADVDAALAAYDRARRARAQPIAAQAARTGRLAQAHGRVAVALRATPPAAVARSLRRLQSFTT